MIYRLQIYGFIAAVTGLVSLVAWAGYSAWQQLGTLHRNFSTVRTESFHLAEHIEATLSEMNELVLRIDLRRTAEDQESLKRESEDLREWLASQKTFLTTRRELELLGEIEDAFRAHQQGICQVLAEILAAGIGPARQPLVETLRENARPMLELCGRLRAAERMALNEFVAESHASVAALRGLLGLSVVLVLVLGFTLSRLIYRARIAPLRAQVVESRALLERQEKLASLGTLAAGVAHEIRNPLTAINVRVHGLKKSLAPGSSEQEDVLVIDEEIRRLDRIVRDFLDFARPSEPRLVTLAVASLFDQVRRLLAPQWRSNAIQLQVEPPPPAWIRADPQQIEQVLINLIQNAADSIETEGVITLRAGVNTARVLGRSFPSVVIEVADTGKGIPREVQQRIFDPFFTTREGGTGLGLAIAAGIIQKHNGVMQFQTKIGRGTTFKLVLPKVEENRDESSA